MLTKRQVQFVNNIATEDGRSATKCAIDAGYSPNCAYTSASQNMQNPEVLRAIDERRAALAAAAGVDPAWWYREMTEMLRARCCRYCYGIENKFQWTAGEYTRAVNEALKMELPVPDFEGGLGFNRALPPSPRCPECAGEGDKTLMKPTDRLKGMELLGRSAGTFKDAPAAIAIATAQVAVAQSSQELSDDQLNALIVQSEGANALGEGSSEGILTIEASI